MCKHSVRQRARRDGDHQDSNHLLLRYRQGIFHFIFNASPLYYNIILEKLRGFGPQSHNALLGDDGEGKPAE